MRILCLLDSPIRGQDRWIWDYLPGGADADVVDFLHTSPRDRYAGWGKFAGYYPSFLQLGLHAHLQSRRRPYDLIVAWESKTGFPIALWRSLAGVHSPRLLILAFSYKGPAARWAGLGRRVVQAIDHVTVVAPDEAEYYSRTLGIPRERITVCPLGGYDPYPDGGPAPGAADGADYIFAGGRSERDYATLLRAVADVDLQVVINARAFNLRGLARPANVQFNDLMAMPEFLATMRRARFVVLPLQDTPYAGGISHIVQAMSCGQTVVATRTSSTVAYVEDGQTGLLVPPYDATALRGAIEHLLGRPEEAIRMGHRARAVYEQRYTFDGFARRCHEVMQRVAGQPGGEVPGVPT